MRSWSAWVLLLAACGPRDPSDDPSDYDVDTGVEYVLQVSEPRWMVPSARLPVETMASNNNVSITFFAGRLFMAWRTSETHFASPNTRMHIVSSDDLGETWIDEHSIALGADVREPHFLPIDGRLFFFFFEAGKDLISFRPQHVYRIERLAQGRWSERAIVLHEGEVHWDMKVRGGEGYMTSYLGNHYGSGEAAIEVYFRRTADGITWAPVDPAHPTSYVGGVSEVAFELESGGGAWFVTRNEDGDATGFGSHLCSAGSGSLGAWQCPAASDPDRYDSPEMFRHGDDLYLVGRRDIGGPFDQGREDLDVLERRMQYALDYWTRPKRTAVYRVDRSERRIEHLVDLPSAGDTAFPSIHRLDAHRFLLANYTSPLDDPDIGWLEGQAADAGTRIYFIELSFVASR